MAKILYWIAPIYTTAIIVLSLTDNQIKVIEVSNSDKIYHGVAYAIMTLLWYLFFYSRYLLNSGMGFLDLKTIFRTWSKEIAIGAAVLAFIVGVLVELGQEYIAVNRTMDVLDALANLTGIIIAIILLYVLSKKFNVE